MREKRKSWRGESGVQGVFQSSEPAPAQILELKRPPVWPAMASPPTLPRSAPHPVPPRRPRRSANLGKQTHQPRRRHRPKWPGSAGQCARQHTGAPPPPARPNGASRSWECRRLPSGMCGCPDFGQVADTAAYPVPPSRSLSWVNPSVRRQTGLRLGTTRPTPPGGAPPPHGFPNAPIRAWAAAPGPARSGTLRCATFHR